MEEALDDPYGVPTRWRLLGRIGITGRIAVSRASVDLLPRSGCIVLCLMAFSRIDLVDQ